MLDPAPAAQSPSTPVENQPPERPPARGLRAAYRDRVTLVGLILVTGMAIGPILRVVLYASFHDGEFRVADLGLTLAMGVVFDAVSLGLLLLPAMFALAFVRFRMLAWAPVRIPLMVVVLGALCFNAVAEYFFFEEFNARFNHIALDYLIYPREVFVNIWDSYNVPLVAGAALVGGLLMAWPVARLTRGMKFARIPWGMRCRAGFVLLLFGGGCIGLVSVVPGSVSNDRIVSEIAQNGTAQLMRAFLTAHLDFELYYRTLPLSEARARAARVLDHEVPKPGELVAPVGEFQLLKDFKPACKDEGYDVVIILEESFGSEFIGVLGHPERRTSPGFDRWSREGILLANLTATGNRTVRGMEGTLCSFPPLPGDSVVKRDHSDNVASVARVLKAKGARTAYFYGGFGLFDSMKPFIRANGYDEFIEQPDYPKQAFRTIWGVADEWVLGAMLQAQVEARAKGQRYCFTALTVSNHKPYYVPRGRCEQLTEKPGRDNAVAYADWALADYFDKAKAAGLLDHTVILAVGDHGARVYGSEEIPAPSYRVPALFLHPDPKWRGVRIERLCSQIDLLPTMLSLAGLGCEAPFFGEDILALPADGGRAFLQHNRDIGLLTDDAMVILGLQKQLYFYRRSGRTSDDFRQVEGTEITPDLRELAKDATSVFQTAYELYVHERFRLPM
ncbi:MAG TPA: sulfatase-like hydrolase/transferase [Planctomycetota bacterium]|nr:sulfatase-like hydrolase/transferase [Planctomycetota bacterium]